MNILHVIGKELARDLQGELPKHLVTAHPAGVDQLTLVIKLKEDKKNSHKFQICRHSRNWRRVLGPTEYVAIHQYHDDPPLYFDLEQPNSLNDLHLWVRRMCSLGTMAQSG